MAYWCDDARLSREQARLDAMQQRAAIAIEAGTAKTAGLGPKGESAGLKGIAKKEQSA